MKERLILALDVPTLREARRFVRLLKNKISIFKVGLELFTSAGPDAVKMIHAEGGRVFLDLKFHDIPNTVDRACASAARLGVFMMNVHARGGADMMKAARAASGRSLLLGVTVLTSDPKSPATSREAVRLAAAAKSVGLHGVVCSPLEASKVRKACGRTFVIVTPGIRWGAWGESGIAPRYDDQKRVSTPAWALQNGADYLVVGRPILHSSDPQKVVSEILAEIQASPI